MMSDTVHPLRQQILTQIEQLPTPQLHELLTFVNFLHYRTQQVELSTSAIDAELATEFAQWEAASDADWLRLEQTLNEAM